MNFPVMYYELLNTDVLTFQLSYNAIATCTIHQDADVFLVVQSGSVTAQRPYSPIAFPVENTVSATYPLCVGNSDARTCTIQYNASDRNFKIILGSGSQSGAYTAVIVYSLKRSKM